MTFQESIQAYALSWSAFSNAVKKIHTLSDSFHSMTVEEKKQFYELQNEANSHAFKCNSIAERIGFQSMTKGYHKMMDSYEALCLVLSQERV
tara:strand:+ start:1081 stop:1356 length:276 start_codon:yes stop_codon:yes gene_type:complete